jgi:SNF2 family DNA or RNA helicase
MKLFAHQQEALNRAREMLSRGGENMYKPFKHQSQGIEIGKLSNKAFLWDCGAGKTFLALHLLKYWKEQGEIPCLVVCPISIMRAAWVEDCKKFTPELDICVFWDKKPANRKRKLAEKHDIYVCNYETLKSLYSEIQAKKFKVIVVDESSRMKSTNSQITRALLAFAGIHTRGKNGQKWPVNHVIPHRYILTATPAPNDNSEYWSQVKFITGPGNDIFNDNFYAFRGRYFFPIPLGRTGQNIWKFRKDTQSEFTDKLSEIAHVVRKQDAVDLPDQVHEIRHIELSKPERQVYDKLKNDLVLEFGDDMVLATSALVEVMKLRQLTSGFLYGETVHQIGKSKLNELKDLLEEIGDNQVIIWANFKHEIATLIKELPNSDALWSGSVDRDATIRNFQQGKIKYLVANPQSAAHGLTFTNCNYAVYYSLNYSYELQKQSEDRIHRIGQKWPCTYYHLIAKDTVDEVIYNAVNNKAELSKEVLNYLRKGKNGTEAKRAKQIQSRQYQTA